MKLFPFILKQFVQVQDGYFYANNNIPYVQTLDRTSMAIISFHARLES